MLCTTRLGSGVCIFTWTVFHDKDKINHEISWNRGFYRRKSVQIFVIIINYSGALVLIVVFFLSLNFYPRRTVYHCFLNLSIILFLFDLLRIRRFFCIHIPVLLSSPSAVILLCFLMSSVFESCFMFCVDLNSFVKRLATYCVHIH